MQIIYEALDSVAQGKGKTMVETYPLAQAPKAYDRVTQGKGRFRAVLTMESPMRAVAPVSGGSWAIGKQSLW